MGVNKEVVGWGAVVEELDGRSSKHWRFEAGGGGQCLRLRLSQSLTVSESEHPPYIGLSVDSTIEEITPVSWGGGKAHLGMKNMCTPLAHYSPLLHLGTHSKI